jgi:methionyl-tRNA formyltransferase
MKTEPVRLVLVTGHTFGISAYEGIFSSPAFLEGRLEVPLVIGLEESRASSTVGYRSVGRLASEQGVSFRETADGRLTSLAQEIRECSPDFLLVVGWSALIPKEILAIPSLQEISERSPGCRSSGCIGMHPTVLPQGRGQAPIPWTIIKGLSSSGLSVFFLEEAADSGGLIAQYPLSVHPRETAASLFYRMERAHFQAGYELAPALAERLVLSMAQDEELASKWPKRRPADGLISPEMTFGQMDALIRGLLGPYPRAFIEVDGRRHLIRAISRTGNDGREGGSRLEPNAGGIRMASADGGVELLLWEDGGKGLPY